VHTCPKALRDYSDAEIAREHGMRMEQLEDLILLKIEHAGLRDGPIGLLDRVKYTVGECLVRFGRVSSRIQNAVVSAPRGRIVVINFRGISEFQ
jgi:hypothetical protein